MFASPEHARVCKLVGEIREILRAEICCWETAGFTQTEEALRRADDALQRLAARVAHPEPGETSPYSLGDVLKTTTNCEDSRSLAKLVAGETIRRPAPEWPGWLLCRPSSAPPTLGMAEQDVRDSLEKKVREMFDAMPAR